MFLYFSVLRSRCEIVFEVSSLFTALFYNVEQDMTIKNIRYIIHLYDRVKLEHFQNPTKRLH